MGIAHHIPSTTHTGQLISNLQSAGGDAWKVFQEAMEAEGTMQAMGAGVAEVANLRQNFFNKFLDVRAERCVRLASWWWSWF